MARIRSIKPEVTQSESFGRLTREARLFFLLLFTQADDEGRMRGSSRHLASLLYPLDRDVDDQIDGWVAELERERMARRYTAEGATYLVICNWLKHQKIDKPTKSKLPAPPEDSPSPRESSRILAPDLDLGSGSGSGPGDRPLAPGASRADAGQNGHDLVGKAEDPIVERIPLCDGTEFAVRKSMRDELDKLYPAVDPDQTLREIRGWNLANPKRRKTPRGIRSHVFDWFKREQDKQSRRPS